jgi:hypothetical protein
VQDDTGVLDTIDVDAYESITEAHIAALDVMIDWFESEEAEEVYDFDDNARSIKECVARQNDIRNYAMDETDIIEISGFKVIYKG